MALLGDDPGWRPLQAVLNFGVLALLYLVHGRWTCAAMRATTCTGACRWLLALPRAAGRRSASAAARCARCCWPESVLTEMNVHSALNVGSALSYIVLVLLMHATLMALVVARLLRPAAAPGAARCARPACSTGVRCTAALDQHARQRRRAADTFSVLMIDVDHFKEVNDRHGHEAGDRALAHIARLMAQALRTQDRLGRYGGEEFVVLLPASNLARALAEAETLRLARAARTAGARRVADARCR